MLVLILVAAFALRIQGIHWPRLHPDEHVIRRWVEQTEKRSYVRERVYPNGFFGLIRIYRWSLDRADNVRNHVRLWTGEDSHSPRIRRDGLLTARMFNVWLGTLTCALFFGFAHRLTNSASAALFAAVLLCFHPLHVEHCHYAQTDIAMLFMLTLSLWAWTWAWGSKQLAPLILASALSGFAIGTKFTLLPLLVLPVWGAVRRGRAFPARRARRVAGELLLCLFACMLGFGMANPAVFHPQWFFASASQQGARVWGETDGLLGPARGSALALFAMRARTLRDGLGSLGWPWILLAVSALPFVTSRRDGRAQWGPLLSFMALYFLYFMALSPWVRPQEFMVFLPFLGLAAAAALAELRRRDRSPPPPAALRVAVPMIAAAAVWIVMGKGIAATTMFGWADTRPHARAWFRAHAPLEQTAAFEIYTDPAHRNTFQHVVGAEKMERPGRASGFAYALAQGSTYFLCNPVFGGRGTFDPKTGRRFPQFQAAYEEFIEQTELLRAWAPLGDTRFSFANPELRFYGLRRTPDGVGTPLVIPQPVGLATRGQTTAFPVGHGLGGTGGVEIADAPASLAVGGPGRPGKIFLVLRTEERGAVVRISGYGRRRTARLAPYDTRVLPLRPPRGLRAHRRFPRIMLRAEPRRNVCRIPCWAAIEFEPARAAAALWAAGYPARALDLLNRHGTGTVEESVVRYLVSVATGDWDGADRDAAAAQDVLEATRSALDHHEPARVLGVDRFFFDEFSRIRLVGVHAVEPEPVTREDTDGRSDTSRIVLPFFFGPGRYRISGQVGIRREPGLAVQPATVELADGDGSHLGSWAISEGSGDGSDPLDVVVEVRRPAQQVLAVQSPVPAVVVLSDFQVRWDTESMLAEQERHLAAAVDAHRLAREDAGRAERRLAHRRDNPVFDPFLRLEAVSIDPHGGAMRCVFDTLVDDVPPLRLVVWRRSGLRWRRVAQVPVAEGSRPRAGDRIAVDAPVDPHTAQDAARLAISIEADVLWIPGTLAVRGARGGLVPLSRVRIGTLPPG